MHRPTPATARRTWPHAPAFALLALAALSCAGRPTPPPIITARTQPEDAPAPQRAAPATPADAPTPARPETTPPAPPSARGPADEDRPAPARAAALLAHLSQLPPARLGDAVAALAPAAAEGAAQAAPPDHPAWGWLTVRRAALAQARGEDAQARAWLDGAGPAAAATPGLQAAADAVRARLTDQLLTRPRTLGVLLPLSGPYGGIGRSARAAIDLALPKESGVTVVVADTRGEADEAARQVDALVRTHGVVAIVGPVGQLESQAAADAAQRLRVPLMALSSGAGLTEAGDFVFRHRMTREAQARRVAEHACGPLRIKRFAILYPRSDYGRALMTAFWAAVEACGGEIRGAEGYDEDATDFAEPIKKLIGRYHLGLRKRSRHWEALNRKARDKALHVPPIVDFDALYIPDGGARAGLILPFLKYWDIELRTDRWQDGRRLAAKYEGEVPPMVQVIGASGFNSQAFVRRAGELAANTLFVDAFWPDANEPARAFAEAYAARTGHPPGALAAHAHDAARLLARAAAGGGDRAAVRAALSTARHEGVFGPTQVSPGGEVSFWPVLLTVIPGQGISQRHDGAAGFDEDAPLQAPRTP